MSQAEQLRELDAILARAHKKMLHAHAIPPKGLSLGDPMPFAGGQMWVRAKLAERGRAVRLEATYKREGVPSVTRSRTILAVQFGGGIFNELLLKLLQETLRKWVRERGSLVCDSCGSTDRLNTVSRTCAPFAPATTIQRILCFECRKAEARAEVQASRQHPGHDPDCSTCTAGAALLARLPRLLSLSRSLAAGDISLAIPLTQELEDLVDEAHGRAPGTRPQRAGAQ